MKIGVTVPYLASYRDAVTADGERDFNCAKNTRGPAITGPDEVARTYFFFFSGGGG
jgi:hypothetical protein